MPREARTDGELDLKGQEGDQEDQVVAFTRTPKVVPPVLRELDEKDTARLSEFVNEDFDAVRNIVKAVCGSEVDEDGAVAEAIARAVEVLTYGRSIDSLTAWITRVAVNVGRSERRRHAVGRRKAPRLLRPEIASSGIEAAADRLDVRNALRSLSGRQAEVVALFYGLDLSVIEVAQVLNRSEGTVKATLSKARSVLTRSLGPAAEEER